jgi:hypothetical protein
MDREGHIPRRSWHIEPPDVAPRRALIGTSAREYGKETARHWPITRREVCQRRRQGCQESRLMASPPCHEDANSRGRLCQRRREIGQGRRGDVPFRVLQSACVGPRMRRVRPCPTRRYRELFSSIHTARRETEEERKSFSELLLPSNVPRSGSHEVADTRGFPRRRGRFTSRSCWCSRATPSPRPGGRRDRRRTDPAAPRTRTSRAARSRGAR